VLVERGTCTFFAKVRAAAARGAAAVLVANNLPAAAPIEMGCGAPDPCAPAGLGVPAVMVGWADGAALAAAAGILWSINYPSIDPLMGILPGLKAFVAAVLGGIGNLPGAALGGVIIGVTETLVSGYISSTYRDAIAFAVLILILLVKPSGLLGKKEIEKV